MVDTPKAFYDLPRARFTWRRPDTGYYIERQAIAIREDELDHWWDLVVGGEGEKAIADGTMAQEIWQIASYGKPFLIPMPNRSQNIRTFPLEDDPLLFQEFAGLDPTEEAVIEFANKHGAMFAEPRGWEALLPGNESLHVLKTPPLSRKQLKQDEAPDDIRESIQEFVERKYIKEYGEFDDKKLQQEFVDKWSREGSRELGYFYDKEPSFVIGETLGSWLNEMTSMKYVVELFRFWENKDIDSLKELFTFTENERAGLRYAYAIENLSVAYTDDELLRRIPPGDVLIPTLLELIRFINNKLRELPVLTKLVMEEDGLKVEPYLVPCNLLSAMWLQFSQHVIGARRSKPCRICGEWVDVTKKREMGKGWERHDKCAANVRATRSNIKKKVTEARRLGEIDDRQVKEIRRELSEANTLEALTAVREKFKAGLEPRKPAAKKPAAKKPTKKPTKKPAAKKTGVAK